MKKSVLEERKYLFKTAYESPKAEILGYNASGVLCQSGFNQDFTDNTTPVDWFTTSGN